MAGIFERISSLAGTEAAKAINLAHETFTGRMGVHGHTGRAIVETIAEVCRNHPNLVGIGAGLLVEQLLVEEKHRHDAHLAAAAASPVASAAPAADGEAAPETAEAAPAPVAGPASALPLEHPDHPDHHINFPHLHVPEIRLSHLRPGRIAAEVFGALILLKLGAVGAHLFRRKSHTEVWFAPASRIHLLSATLASYYFIKAARSPKVSAWRNAAVALFATDAIKPLLKVKKGAAASPAPAMARPAASARPLQLS
jgi:hypothetical protein